jgi:hypothetical protein
MTSTPWAGRDRGHHVPHDRRSAALWESLLPAEVLRLPAELARVDALLDDLCAEVSGSNSWRRFCRIPLDGRVPHPTKLTTRCPVEFGFKARLIDNDDGIVLDYCLEAGNPPDGPQLAPVVTRVARRACRVPRAVPADRGYGQPAAERDLRELGVRIVAMPASPQPHHRARPSSTAAASGGWSSGAPAAKDGSATSNAATAETAPAWTAGTEPRSGADTEYSPTTCSRHDGLPPCTPW